MVDARTDKTWDAMQKQDEGVSLPRKESFEAIYDNKIVNEVNKFFGKKAWGNAKVAVGEIGRKYPEIEDDYAYISPTGNVVAGATSDGARNAIKKTDPNLKEVQNSIEVWTLPITPQMRERSLFEGMTLFSKVVTDKKLIDKLESGKKIKVYRAMQVIDGKLYPPMSAKVEGKLRPPSELGKWEQAVEQPELAKNGKFKLDKANKSAIDAAYNPYIHTSKSPLNDQFSSAYNRDNLVTVEVEVPESELTSGYQAEGAKDSVGEKAWHSGPVSSKLSKKRTVILSRYVKPIRIVPDSEVADQVAETLKGEDVTIPGKVVTPSLRKELIKRGVSVTEPSTGRTLFSFADTQGPVTQSEVDEFLNSKSDPAASALRQVKKGAKAVSLATDKFLGAISTRLGNIDAGLKAAFRKLDHDTGMRGTEDSMAVEPMLRKAKKSMDKRDFKLWHYVRMNGDIDRINDLVDKYDLRKEWDAYNAKLASIREEALAVGLDIGLVDNYSPRWVKDYKGFLEAIGKEERYAPVFQRFDARAKELGVEILDLTQQEKADILSDMIFGVPKGLGGVTAAKERILEKVPPNLVEFYAHSDAALMKHLGEMRKAIELRKFFGKIPERVAETRSQLKSAQTKIRAFNQTLSDGNMSDEKIADVKKKRNELIETEKELQAEIDKYATQFDFKPDIIAYTLNLVETKGLSSEEQEIVLDIFKARFVDEHGTHGGWSAYKNFSYADTMGSPASALTQVGDLAWAMYEGGVIRTLKNVYKSAIGASRITKEDVGVTRIGQEFADPGKMASAVSFIFKWVGLEKMDAIGKEALLNTAHEMYQKKAKKDPAKLAKEIKGVFGVETQSVIDDLLNDNISDNVKLLVYNRLADFQPIGLSEMPQKYLDAGNGRIFYMLKTFTIKQFDAFRNESYNKIKNGDKREKIQGMQNLIKLAAFFVLANAGADELKDLLLGRKTDLNDRVVDNMLRLGGISKFITWKARTEGAASAMFRQILPPFKFIDSTTKDIWSAGDDKGLEAVGSVPFVGKLAYWHMGRGDT